MNGVLGQTHWRGGASIRYCLSTSETLARMHCFILHAILYVLLCFSVLYPYSTHKLGHFSENLSGSGHGIVPDRFANQRVNLSDLLDRPRCQPD